MVSYETVLTQVIDVIGAHFATDRQNIHEATMREDIDGWDSVSFPGLMLAIEDKFHVILPSEVIVEVETVGELARITYNTLPSA